MRGKTRLFVVCLLLLTAIFVLVRAQPDKSFFKTERIPLDFSNNRSPIVLIADAYGNVRGEVRGTGVVVWPGFVITSCHIVRSAEAFAPDPEYFFVGFGDFWQKAAVEKTTPMHKSFLFEPARSKSDLALLRVNSLNTTPAFFGIGDKNLAGSVVSWSTPIFQRSYRGIVLEHRNLVNTAWEKSFFGTYAINNVTEAAYLIVDSDSDPGNSGSPAFTDVGEVVGIVSQSCGEKRTCLIAIEDILEFLREQKVPFLHLN